MMPPFKIREAEMRSRTKNLYSLISGKIFILVGLRGTIITSQASKPIIIIPIVSLVIGAILAILGGLEKWQ